MNVESKDLPLQGIFLADCSAEAEQVSMSCAAELARHPVTIHAIFVSPDDSQEIVDAVTRPLSNVPVIRTTRPDKDPFILELLDAGNIDLIFSHSRYRVRPRLLNGVTMGAVNLHPSVLPLNRGRHPSFWGIMDKTKLGATIR